MAEVDPGTYNWFTGDGMVHGVRIRDGRAEWYRNAGCEQRSCRRRPTGSVRHRRPVRRYHGGLATGASKVELTTGERRTYGTARLGAGGPHVLEAPCTRRPSRT